MNTSVQAQSANANTPAPTGFLSDVVGAGAEPAASPAVVPADDAVGAVVGETGFDLTLEDVGPEIEGPDIKDTSDFVVRFLKAADSKKKLKGSTAALETLFHVKFTRPVPVAAVVEEEEKPKKRGRKSAAEKAAKIVGTSYQQYAVMRFYDDAANKAADFIDSLAGRTGFSLQIGSLNESGAEVETFQFDDCSVIPTAVVHDFSLNQESRPRELTLALEFKESTRLSLSTEEADE